MLTDVLRVLTDVLCVLTDVLCALTDTRTHTDSHGKGQRVLTDVLRVLTDVLRVLTDGHGRPLCTDGRPRTSFVC